MSRLYDRVMANGCEPLTGMHVVEAVATHGELRQGAADFLREEVLGREPSADEVSEQMELSRRATRQTVSSEVFEAADFDGAVVVAAEEVADFWSTLPDGTNTLDIVDRLVPPFDRVFVEFQNRPNAFGLRSWGVLLQATNDDLVPQEGFDEQRWLVTGILVGEWEKGKPVGPILRWVIPLDSAGYAFPGDAEGRGSFFADPLKLGTLPEEELQKFTDSLITVGGPALMAMSFMHCKNVDVHPVDPPERLSRKHERRHGRPLTRYHVLNVEPMRRVLTSEGEAQSKGLRHAMHICRGHFKTYTEDAPLFGRHTGTYWWESQARGKAEHGVVEKDYRIRLDQGLGREYAYADEHPEIQPTAPEHTGLDPDLGGRGLRAHNVTQNALAQAVREAGHEPRRPKPDEPQYDLAWEDGDTTWVAEVKSVTPQNEERQLRTALGQVLRYRQLLEADRRRVRAMIATEVEPSDPSWAELCAREGIVLVWGPDNLAVATSH